MILAGIYAPQAQFWEVFNKILQVGGTELIVLGDFNAMVNNLEDKSSDSKSLEQPKVF